MRWHVRKSVKVEKKITKRRKLGMYLKVYVKVLSIVKKIGDHY